MKNKLRKILIDGIEYYYRFTYKYYDSYDMCKSTFKAFKGEVKNYPLTVNIDTIADKIIGNPLNVGIAIGNGKNINLNCPKWARLIIVYGIEKGWNGNSILNIDGNYDLLKKIETIYG